ncbi:MAG: protein-glutamate methylesterase/protein-glutamine glutaminase [Deltaproteobacteria bacterium]
MRLLKNKKIKVLIVDDSLVFRESLARGVGSDPGIEVVGCAFDPYSARDLIIQTRPDVITLDVEMPRMDGIEFLKKLMPQYPLPAIMVSGMSTKVFEALHAGAVDFVVKPDANNRISLDSLIKELIVKIKIASTAKVGHWKSEVPQRVIDRNGSASEETMIAIGASTGGTEAIAYILRMLPRSIPGTLIVQHMPPVFTRMYAERLNNSCLMEVIEARDGDRVLPGRVLIAPGDAHMRLKKKGGVYQVECRSGERVNGHCPSVDVLFHSCVDYACNVIGIILTGMGSDGAQGLLALRRRGARTIGQNEETCVVYGMPKSAYDLGAVEQQLALSRIPQAIYANLKNDAASEEG